MHQAVSSQAELWCAAVCMPCAQHVLAAMHTVASKPPPWFGHTELDSLQSPVAWPFRPMGGWGGYLLKPEPQKSTHDHTLPQK